MHGITIFVHLISSDTMVSRTQGKTLVAMFYSTIITVTLILLQGIMCPKVRTVVYLCVIYLTTPPAANKIAISELWIGNYVDGISLDINYPILLVFALRRWKYHEDFQFFYRGFTVWYSNPAPTEYTIHTLLLQSICCLCVLIKATGCSLLPPVARQKTTNEQTEQWNHFNPFHVTIEMST
jgi:hypothetical protein